MPVTFEEVELELMVQWVDGMKHVNVNGGLKEKINGIDSVTGS